MKYLVKLILGIIGGGILSLIGLLLPILFGITDDFKTSDSLAGIGFYLGYPVGSSIAVYFSGKIYKERGSFIFCSLSGLIGFAVACAIYYLSSSAYLFESIISLFALFLLPPSLALVGYYFKIRRT